MRCVLAVVVALVAPAAAFAPAGLRATVGRGALAATPVSGLAKPHVPRAAVATMKDEFMEVFEEAMNAIPFIAVGIPATIILLESAFCHRRFASLCEHAEHVRFAACLLRAEHVCDDLKC